MDSDRLERIGGSFFGNATELEGLPPRGTCGDWIIDMHHFFSQRLPNLHLNHVERSDREIDAGRLECMHLEAS